MANTLFTFDQIVKFATDLAGNPGLYQVPADDTVSRGYRLAQMILDDWFLTYDWECNLVYNLAWSIGLNGYTVNLPYMQGALFVITNNNNKLDIAGTGAGTYTIANGIYTGPALATAIIAALGGSATCTYSVVNNAFTIGQGGGNFQILFNSGANQNLLLAQTLGFTGVDTPSAAAATSAVAAVYGTYSHMDQVIITSPAQSNMQPLEEKPWKDLNNSIQQAMSATTPVTSTPKYMHVAPDRSTFWVYPPANKTYSGLYSFYIKPNVNTYTATTILPFEDSYALITALAAIIQVWDKESRSQVMADKALQLGGGFRTKHEDSGRVNGRAWRWGPSYSRIPSNSTSWWPPKI